MSEEEKEAIEIIKGLTMEEYDWYEDSKYCQGHSGEVVEIVENSLEKILNLIDRQQKEIEEKTTILLTGAEKVKQLEKEIEELKEELQRQINTRLINEKYVEDNFISKDEIRELKEKVEKEMISNPYDFSYMINQLLGE